MNKRIFLLVVPAILVIAYLSGPKPASPDLDKNYSFQLPDSLNLLENEIVTHEKAVAGIKKGNEAKIIWADSIPQKTKYSLVYIHGFSASREEGAPVHTDLAQRYHANLYLARWEEHGIDLGDETMANLTADKMIESAEKALAIGKKIGQKVIVIGTSAGGALTAYLASKHPEIEAIILYSPCIKIYDDNAELMDNPWGLQMGRMVQGKDFNDIVPKNDQQPLFWTMHYRLEAVVALQNFITHTMNEETFSKIKCPVFIGYYFKDEENQDKVVSIPAILKMYDELGTSNKQKEAFPDVNNHVLASYVLSENWQKVENSTATFLDNIIKIQDLTL